MTDNAPTDQELNVEGIHATTTQVADDPPTLHLVLDVEHAETGHIWRMQLAFTKPKWIELMQLLDYAADTEGVRWR